MLRPAKHHPSVSYVHQVKLGKMVLFTLLQAAGLALLWLVKSFPDIALLFPFFIVLMIPYRYIFKYFFTEVELNAVSKTKSSDLTWYLYSLSSLTAQRQVLWSRLTSTKARVISTGDLWHDVELKFYATVTPNLNKMLYHTPQGCCIMSHLSEVDTKEILLNWKSVTRILLGKKLSMNYWRRNTIIETHCA